MGKMQKTYIKENFIDVIYCLVDAYKKSRITPDKDNIKKLCPINGAYSGYAINKVQFKDPRNGKTYIDTWERNRADNEEDRLKVIRKINEKIRSYNKFVKKHEKELGLDKIDKWQYHAQSEYPEWALSLYLSKPTLNSTGQVMRHRKIDNHWFYQKATMIPRVEFILRFNKTIYDWIIHMLPQSFNDNGIKFLSDKHILFEPKLEFENWFMKNGLLINDYPSLFDDFEGEEKKESISELEILQNTDIAKTKKIKELRLQVKMAKEPYRAKVDTMIEEKTLDDFIDKNCRKKNGKMNWAELGRQLGCHADTARKIMLETGKAYLFDDSKNTYLE